MREIGNSNGDPWPVRIACICLGLTALCCALISGRLTSEGKETPHELVAIGSACVGAVAGLLVRRPR